MTVLPKPYQAFPTSRSPERGGVRIVSAHALQIAAAEHFGITLVDLLAHRRSHPGVLARQIAMALAMEMTLLSTPQIAHAFYRDRTTVEYAVARVRRLRATDAAVEAACRSISAQFDRPKYLRVVA